MTTAHGSAAMEPWSRRTAWSQTAIWAVAAGMLAGWLHWLIITWERLGRGNLIWFSRDFAWQAPIAYALLFLVAGCALAFVIGVSPRLLPDHVLGFVFTVLGAFGLLLPFPQIARLAALALAVGLGVVVSRMVRSDPAGWRRRVPRLAMGLSLLTLGALALILGKRATAESRATASLPDARAGAPNMLLIILDTVRAASLSLYGHQVPTTPALERWASEGVVFDWAIAPAPWTLPTHGSLFTGLPAGDLSGSWTRPLDRAHRTLAEVFAAHGYATIGITANHHYTAFDSGLDRGFQLYRSYRTTFVQLMLSTSYTQTALFDDLITARSVSSAWKALSNPDLSIEPKHTSHRRTADLVTEPFLEWQAKSAGRPFFAFLNYFDAHQGYYSPPDFPAVATGRGGKVAYQNAIAWLDSNIDKVLSTLRERGVLDNTVIVITSDHGELFGERKLFGHAHNLYLNTLRVPLVIRYPARVEGGKRIGRAVSLTNLGSTLLDLAGIDERFPGATLTELMADSTAPIGDVISEVFRAPNVNPAYPTAKGDLVAIFDDQWHVILNPDSKEEIFRYREDEVEANDLGGQAEALAATTLLRERLRGLRPVARTGGPVSAKQ